MLSRRATLGPLSLRIALGRSAPPTFLPLAQATLGSRHRSNTSLHKKHADKWARMSKEEQSEAYMALMERMDVPLARDMTRLPVGLLEHVIPVPLSQASKGTGVWSWLRERARSQFQNAFHLQTIAGSQTFLGLPNAEPPKSSWSSQIFRTQSLNDSSWLTPLRIHGLERYILLNEAQSKGDIKTLKATSAAPKLPELLKQVESRSKDLLYVWKYHGEKNPTQCLSVRTVMDQSDPSKVGIAQAALKFDTLQSVAVYDKKSGKLLQQQGTPEEPTNVVEYMVLEKDMRQHGPWMIRAQLHPGVKPELVELF